MTASCFGRILILVSGLCLCWSTMVQAQPETVRRYSQSDIEIRADQEWPRANSGGYFPIMMTVKNRGPDARVRIYASGDSSGSPGLRTFMPLVEKRLELAQNATTRLTFLIPAVSRHNLACIRVAKDGRRLDQIEIPVLFADEVGERSFLVVDENIPNTAIFKRYCDTTLSASSTGYSGHQIVQRLPRNMPETWLAYSGLDMVLIDAQSFAREMEDSARSELLRWVSTGGCLVIYNTARLEDRLAAVDEAIESANWKVETSDWKTRTSDLVSYRNTPGGDFVKFSLKLEERGLLFGKLVAMEKTPFDFGDLDDVFNSSRGMLRTSPRLSTPRSGSSSTFYSHPGWDHIFATVGNDSASWLKRHGFSPRSYSTDFLYFLNPGIQKLPTWGFVSLITLFAIVIGPVNYLVLKRRNMVSQMLWTTPLIALATTLLLFGWSSVANGTASHVRLRSLSMLDQGSQSLVTQSRVAIFSGVTPKDALRFEPHSAVYPVWQEEGSFRTGSVDWTNAQELSGSFHRGNSRSQFAIYTPRTERGRLQLGELNDEGLSVTNGLEWDIAKILVRNRTGNYFVGEKLDAGNSMVLRPADEKEIKQVRGRVAEQKLKMPNARPPSSSTSTFNRRMARMNFEGDSARFSTSNMERKFMWLSKRLSSVPEKSGIQGESIDHGLPHGSYLAVLSDNPNVEVGLGKYRLTEQLHVLLGVFE